jgi:hypothetical protein
MGSGRVCALSRRLSWRTEVRNFWHGKLTLVLFAQLALLCKAFVVGSMAMMVGTSRTVMSCKSSFL